MTLSYDVTTAVGQVRLMIPDRDLSVPIFTDEEITAFLAIELDNLRRGTALALETIASDQVLVLKVIQLLDLKTDGKAVAEALMTRASSLRAQADDAEAREGGDFDWAEMVEGPFTWRERLYKEWQRRG